VRYLLDTNVCIRILNGTSPAVVTRLRRSSPGDIGVSAVVRAELVYGAQKSARPAENLRVVAAFLGPFGCLPFDQAAADAYGGIRASLERVGRPIGPNDLLIAATAIARSMTLVTHNTNVFARVPGLNLEDWEA
jgi:tRNA(fMet)-specific endonuclease VapC